MQSPMIANSDPFCMAVVLHGTQARFVPREWPRQEEGGGHELEGKVNVDITGIPNHYHGSAGFPNPMSAHKWKSR